MQETEVRDQSKKQYIIAQEKIFYTRRVPLKNIPALAKRNYARGISTKNIHADRKFLISSITFLMIRPSLYFM